MRRRYTDEDILRVLDAGDSGQKVADLCAAENVSEKTYYAWKVKYGNLTPSELKSRRLRERRLRLGGSAAVALVLVGAGYTFLVNLAAPPAPVSVVRPGDVRPIPAPPAKRLPPVSVSRPEPSSTPAPEPKQTTPESARRDSADPPVPPRSPQPSIEGISTVDPEGVSVQVAALSRLEDARRLVDRLARAGYPVYVTRKPGTGAEPDMYRVRVGAFANRAIAEEAAASLERNGYGKVWVAR